MIESRDRHYTRKEWGKQMGGRQAAAPMLYLTQVLATRQGGNRTPSRR